MNVVVENTIYSIFLYMLLNDEWEKSVFIVDDKNIFKLLEGKYKAYLLPKIPYKNFMKYYIEKIKFFLFLKKQGIIFNSNVSIYGNINLFRLFFLKRKMYILEDGLADYNVKYQHFSLIQLLKMLIKCENPYFFLRNKASWVNKVYLTNENKDEDIKSKVSKINVTKIWEIKNKRNKTKILEFFNINQDYIQKLKFQNTILVTQPLSEDKLLTEHQKVELYRMVMNNYRQKDILIKPHPREITNYKEIFINSMILESIIPLELLYLIGLKIDRIVTVYSTVALNLSDKVKIDIYGTEICPKLLYKIGSMKSCIKTTAYLKKGCKYENIKK